MPYSKLLKLASIFLYAAKETEPEAPASAPFGEYAWPSKREGMNHIKENPTELETQIFRDLRSHFASKKIRLPQESVKLLQKCLKNEWYKKVLHPPPYKELYRGMYFSTIEKFKEFSGLSDKEIENDSFMAFPDGKTFKSIDGYSTSWAFKKSITKDFSTNYGKAKKGYAVTLIAKVSDNKDRFLAGPGGLYDVEGVSKWHLEKETVGLEPVNVARIEWFKIDSVDD